MNRAFQRIAFVSLLALATASGRTWTANDGRKIEADYVSSDGESVVIKLDDNDKEFTVPFAKLSEADVQWVKDRVASDAKAASEAAKKEAEEKASEETVIVLPDGQRITVTEGFGDEDSVDPRSEFDVPADKEKPANWTAAWPATAEVSNKQEIEILKEDEEAEEWIYASKNYEFICDVRLSKQVVSRFAALFEATRLFCGSLPINMQRARRPAGETRDKIILCESEVTFIENGGSPSAAGVYIPWENKILIPLTSLGVQKVGSSYMVDHDRSNKTLPHEICHQLTDSVYSRRNVSLGWFTEGLAEYIGATSYRSGRFGIKTNFRDIREYVTEYDYDKRVGRALGDQIQVMDLEAFMKQPYRRFAGSDGNKNYGVGALLVYYFFHFDDNGSRKNITNFLKALREKKSDDEVFAALLGGRSFDQLEKDIIEAWGKKGVDFAFR